MKYLVVDGMLSGSGIRDYYDGGYVDIEALSLSSELKSKIQVWLEKYEEQHFDGFADSAAIDLLDCQGIELAKRLLKELGDVKVEYYSAAKMKKIEFDKPAL